MGAPRHLTRARTGVLRHLSGVLAAGLAVLALALAVSAVVASRTGSPGPGASALTWHGVGAVLAVAGQLYADRVPGRRGALVAWGVLAMTAAVLVTQWLI